MRWNHARLYSCKAPEHEGAVFNTKESLKLHLIENHHGDCHPNELQGILEGATIPCKEIFA